jgi:hypothetical protein
MSGIGESRRNLGFRLMSGGGKATEGGYYHGPGTYPRRLSTTNERVAGCRIPPALTTASDITLRFAEDFDPPQSGPIPTPALSTESVSRPVTSNLVFHKLIQKYSS